jgi:hypothetical protein
VTHTRAVVVGTAFSDLAASIRLAERGVNHAEGRNTTLWPDLTYRFVRRTRRFDAENYLLTSRPLRPRGDDAAAVRTSISITPAP